MNDVASARQVIFVYNHEYLTFLTTHTKYSASCEVILKINPKKGHLSEISLFSVRVALFFYISHLFLRNLNLWPTQWPSLRAFFVLRVQKAQHLCN